MLTYYEAPTVLTAGECESHKEEDREVLTDEVNAGVDEDHEKRKQAEDDDEVTYR